MPVGFCIKAILDNFVTFSLGVSQVHSEILFQSKLVCWCSVQLNSISLSRLQGPLKVLDKSTEAAGPTDSSHSSHKSEPRL